ncbi:hypothetical protein TNCV_4868681 [Trichonephila clavipes]|nr:hypothetical protein TNCV_4868681 [Trichonephila clavipes]
MAAQETHEGLGFLTSGLCPTCKTVVLTKEHLLVRPNLGPNLQIEAGEHSRKYVGWAVGSLVVRASDSSPEGLGSMPDVTKYPPSTHGDTLVKSVGPKLLWAESRAQGTGEYFPPLQFNAEIVRW